MEINMEMEMEINHVEYDTIEIKGLLRLQNFLFSWQYNKPDVCLMQLPAL